MSYKVGDYVVNKRAELILHIINVLEIVEVSDKAAMCKYVVPPKETIPFNSEGKVFLNIEDLRPAVLSDWAKEIPEKYRDDTGGGGYIILVNFDEIKHIKMLYYMDNKLYEVNDYTYFEADAISAHYGIPIMPYEKYEEYMKENKKILDISI